MKKAMITIEVLIAMMILFLVISTSFTTIKFFNINTHKKIFYEDNYIEILNIKEKLSSKLCKDSFEMTGDINGYDYSAKCDEKKEARSYRKAFDFDEKSGNYGENLMKLFQITVQVKKDKLKKTYRYYITRGVKVQ